MDLRPGCGCTSRWVAWAQKKSLVFITTQLTSNRPNTNNLSLQQTEHELRDNIPLTLTVKYFNYCNVLGQILVFGLIRISNEIPILKEKANVIYKHCKIKVLMSLNICIYMYMYFWKLSICYRCVDRNSHPDIFTWTFCLSCFSVFMVKQEPYWIISQFMLQRINPWLENNNHNYSNSFEQPVHWNWKLTKSKRALIIAIRRKEWYQQMLH